MSLFDMVLVYYVFILFLFEKSLNLVLRSFFVKGHNCFDHTIHYSTSLFRSSDLPHQLQCLLMR